VGDREAAGERIPRPGLIDVVPPMVVSQLCERVDQRLIDCLPRAGPEALPDEST